MHLRKKSKMVLWAGSSLSLWFSLKGHANIIQWSADPAVMPVLAVVLV